MRKRPETLSDNCPDTSPILLLMDNINLYRGRKRHLPLFKDQGPKMWNFTGRAVVIPDIADIEELMKCPTTVTMSQTDVTSIKSDDLFLGKNYFQM